jgi:hypothetical protein
MKMAEAIPATLLAPCGVNCYVCYVYLRKKKPCLGCHGVDANKPNHCRNCKIKDCAKERGVDFCFDCADFPCKIIKRMDKSYRQRYQVSLIENATLIKSNGAEAFLLAEKAKWSCAHCDGVVSLHDQICSECGETP